MVCVCVCEGNEDLHWNILISPCVSDRISSLIHTCISERSLVLQIVSTTLLYSAKFRPWWRGLWVRGGGRGGKGMQGRKGRRQGKEEGPGGKEAPVPSISGVTVRVVRWRRYYFNSPSHLGYYLLIYSHHYAPCRSGDEWPFWLRLHGPFSLTYGVTHGCVCECVPVCAGVGVCVCVCVSFWDYIGTVAIDCTLSRIIQ